MSLQPVSAAARRQGAKPRAARTSQFVAPGAVRRQSHDQVIEQDLRSIFHSQSRKPLCARCTVRHLPLCFPCPLAGINQWASTLLMEMSMTKKASFKKGAED